MSFFNENFETNQDSNSKKEIIIAIVAIIFLGGFFFWYNNRFSGLRGSSQNDNGSDGILANLIGKKSDTTVATIQDDDYDGLSNEEEKSATTDVRQPDSDSDGLTDREEIKVYGTDPKKSDSDGDGKSDGDEIRNRSNPKDPSPSSVWPPEPASLRSNN